MKLRRALARRSFGPFFLLAATSFSIQVHRACRTPGHDEAARTSQVNPPSKTATHEHSFQYNMHDVIERILDGRGLHTASKNPDNVEGIYYGL